MQKKLTIILDENVYDGLHKVVGQDNISQFIERLVRSYVITDVDLDAAYREMAQNEMHEAEAME